MDTVKKDPESDPLWIPDEQCIQEVVCVKKEDSAIVKQESENDVIIEDREIENLKSSDIAHSQEVVSTDHCDENEPLFNIHEPSDIDFSVDKCYKCEICHRKFTTWSAVKSHSTNIHRNKKLYKCDLCQRAYIYLGSFKLHSCYHNAEKLYKCEICNKKYKFLGFLDIHTNSHNRQNRAYECELCHRKFTRRYNLKNHSFVHTGLKPYSCQHCGVCFSTQGNLKRHSDRNRCRVIA